MSVSIIINIVLAVLALGVGFAATYYKGNSKLIKAVTGYIAQAEATYTSAKSGGAKMQYVVGKLYALLPAVIRPFIPESVIQTICQAIFDKVDAYAKLQLDKAVDKALPDNSTVIGTVTDTPTAATVSTGTAQATQTQQVTSGLAAK